MKSNQEIVEAMRRIQSICHCIFNPDKFLLLPHNEMSFRCIYILCRVWRSMSSNNCSKRFLINSIKFLY